MSYYLNPIAIGPATDTRQTTAGTPYTVIIQQLQVGDVFYYEHNQAVPAGDWLVQHNLGKIPNVTVFDDTGAEILADVNTVDANTVHVIFPYMATGKAICS